jgi:hypothetical protein
MLPGPPQSTFDASQCCFADFLGTANKEVVVIEDLLDTDINTTVWSANYGS